MKEMLKKTIVLVLALVSVSAPMFASAQQFVPFNGGTGTGSVSPSSSVMGPITPEEALNQKAKDDAAKSNTTINNDIYNPNKSFKDVNTDLYNAGKATNQSAVSATSNNCSVSIKKFGDIFIVAACVINRFLISIAVSFALVYFTWGVVQYVLSADSAEERKKSKQVMLWGVLALFVIVSVWGIVGFMRTIIGV